MVTVATIHGGARKNIIPDQVEMSGTIRTFDAKAREIGMKEAPAVIQASGAGSDFTACARSIPRPHSITSAAAAGASPSLRSRL